MVATFFNLFVNACTSMLAGLFVVSLFLWIFRVPTGSWKVFWLSVPFVKIVYDFVRGVPETSILAQGLDFFSIPPGYRLLTVGTGLSKWGPVFNATLFVEDQARTQYSVSLGDVLYFWVKDHHGESFCLFLLVLLMLASVGLVTRRLWAFYKFHQERSLDRVQSSLLRTEFLSFRRIDIYLSKHFSGSPFTGGIFRPYICVPQSVYETLSSVELEAVLLHEIKHVRSFDAPMTFLIQILGDIFWFVPGYRWLSRKIDRLRELVADQSAIKQGAAPEYLASALVKIKELDFRNAPLHGFYSAFFRERSLLKQRVERLLVEKQDPSARCGWSLILVRVAASVWLVGATVMSTMGGNHQSVDMSPLENWIELLKNMLTNI